MKTGISSLYIYLPCLTAMDENAAPMELIEIPDINRLPNYRLYEPLMSFTTQNIYLPMGEAFAKIVP